MLFTRECDYAVRILRALASGEIVSISRICQREQLSTAIAYKIARKLEKAGLIESYRGNTGGYALACDLYTTTLFDVFHVMDPNQLLSECMDPDYDCPLNSSHKPCLVHREMCRIQGLLNQSLKEKSLKEILRS